MSSEILLKSLRWRHRPFPELVRLAWPISVSMLSYSVMTLVGTLFVGRLGASALAGVGIGGIYTFTLLCFGFGLLRSVKVLVSQAVGAGQRARISGFVGAGLVIALALGTANVALGWTCSRWLHVVVSGSDAAALAAAYANIRVVGAPFVLGSIALREARYGLGDARIPMRAAVLANLVNIALDYLLIVQLGQGVSGAATASVLAQGVELAVLVLAQRRDGFGLGREALASLGRVWRMGVPLGAQMILEVSSFALLTAIVARMGEVDAAAHQIGIQVAHFSFLPAVAVGEAASVLVGQAVGARALRLVPKVARLTVIVAAAYTGACGLAFYLLSRPIAGLFSADPALIACTSRVLVIAAAFQIFDGASIVARCILRGTGDVRYPAVVSVAIAWLAGPPLAVAFGYGLGMGVAGAWLGLCVDLGVGALVLWLRLVRGGWLPWARRARVELRALAA